MSSLKPIIGYMVYTYHRGQKAKYFKATRHEAWDLAEEKRKVCQRVYFNSVTRLGKRDATNLETSSISVLSANR
jgi:hypothetical protein